ncbi:hypothetical protein JXR01_00265 [Candidatus Kaiserbacteria bacterium]|nr:MAG: hypothetical protein JXR01_00265 [Candidatus Kaiserbacteria bacterium]
MFYSRQKEVGMPKSHPNTTKSALIDCQSCDGSGTIAAPPHTNPDNKDLTCPNCKGSKKEPRRPIEKVG